MAKTGRRSGAPRYTASRYFGSDVAPPEEKQSQSDAYRLKLCRASKDRLGGLLR